MRLSQGPKGRPRRSGRVGFLGRGYEPPSHQLQKSEGCQRVQVAQIDFCIMFDLYDHWQLRFLPMISCVYRYGKIWRTIYIISIGFPITRLASPALLILLQNTSTTTHYSFIVQAYRNEIVGVEQSFTVFLHGKAASRPFKLIFLRANISTFPREVKCPHPCPCQWAPPIGGGGGLDPIIVDLFVV